MSNTINAKTLRRELARIVERVRKGEDFTVLYRSRLAFRIVPVDEPGLEKGDLEDDPVYRAGPVGESRDGRVAEEHDQLLYRKSRS